MRKKRKPTFEIEYTIEAVPDDTPVCGNAQVSGDDAADKAVEDAICARLDHGDVWAWACVSVRAKCEGFEGRANLGCCSYKDQAEFEAGGYLDDLRAEALEDLRSELLAAIERGAKAAELFTRIERG